MTASRPEPASAAIERWLERLDRLDPRRIELGLERMQRVLARLPIGERPALTLLVGGTNGKGSCVAYLEAMLAAGGYRVGAYTSPHLLRYHERVRMHGRLIDDDDLLASFEAVEAARGDVPLTYFEFGTLAALFAFAASACDAWVLEVGLGGRLDAVNALEPDGSLVVSIGLDHQDWLGTSREAIGREKAGIFRSGRPAVCADPRPPRSLLHHAETIGARLVRVGHEYRIRRHRGHWSYRSGRLHLPRLAMPPLAGAVQLRNAAASIALLEACLGPRAVEPMATGLERARLPGRFQRLREGDIEWVLDVAHNPPAARALADTLRRTRPAGRTLAVFGILASKDFAAVLDALQPHVDEWAVAPAEGGTEPVAAATLEQRLRQRGALAARHDSVADACCAARARAQPGDRIVVAGSFHTVGPALAWLAVSSPQA